MNTASLGTWMCMVFLAPFNPSQFRRARWRMCITHMGSHNPLCNQVLPSRHNAELPLAIRSDANYIYSWSVVRLARMMNSPIPREVQISASNELNAATDDFTLFITSRDGARTLD